MLRLVTFLVYRLSNVKVHASERMNDCPVVSGRKYDVECGLVRRGPVGSDGVRLGPMGSDWVISHTAVQVPVLCMQVPVPVPSTTRLVGGTFSDTGC